MWRRRAKRPAAATTASPTTTTTRGEGKTRATTPRRPRRRTRGAWARGPRTSRRPSPSRRARRWTGGRSRTSARVGRLRGGRDARAGGGGGRGAIEASRERRARRARRARGRAREAPSSGALRGERGARGNRGVSARGGQRRAERAAIDDERDAARCRSRGRGGDGGDARSIEGGAPPEPDGIASDETSRPEPTVSELAVGALLDGGRARGRRAPPRGVGCAQIARTPASGNIASRRSPNMRKVGRLFSRQGDDDSSTWQKY